MSGIDFDIAQFQERIFHFRGESRSPEDGTDPRQQFGHAERLGQITIGASVERLNLVSFRAAHCNHDNGEVGPKPNLTARLYPRNAGHIDVEEH